MTFSELAKERFSCRKFSTKAVEQDKIDIILNAALAAPTAVNKQPQRILVINDSEKLAFGQEVSLAQRARSIPIFSILQT